MKTIVALLKNRIEWNDQICPANLKRREDCLVDSIFEVIHDGISFFIFSFLTSAEERQSSSVTCN